MTTTTEAETDASRTNVDRAWVYQDADDQEYESLRHGPYSVTLILQEGLLPDEVVEELRNALEMEFLP